MIDRCYPTVASLGGGGGARPGWHHFGVTPFVCFFSFETENPLIGRQRPFFWSLHTFGLKTNSFCSGDLFFLVFTYILADKGCHHEIPPRVPPFLATPLLTDPPKKRKRPNANSRRGNRTIGSLTFRSVTDLRYLSDKTRKFLGHQFGLKG